MVGTCSLVSEAEIWPSPVSSVPSHCAAFPSERIKNGLGVGAFAVLRVLASYESRWGFRSVHPLRESVLRTASQLEGGPRTLSNLKRCLDTLRQVGLITVGGWELRLVPVGEPSNPWVEKEVYVRQVLGSLSVCGEYVVMPKDVAERVLARGRWGGKRSGAGRRAKESSMATNRLDLPSSIPTSTYSLSKPKGFQPLSPSAPSGPRDPTAENARCARIEIKPQVTAQRDDRTAAEWVLSGSLAQLAVGAAAEDRAPTPPVPAAPPPEQLQLVAALPARPPRRQKLPADGRFYKVPGCGIAMGATFTPPSRPCLDGAPPYPTTDYLHVPTVPRPPLLDDEASEEDIAFACLKAYRGAVEAMTKQPCKVLSGYDAARLSRWSGYSRLLQGAVMLHACGVAPAAWCAFSVDAWRQHVRKHRSKSPIAPPLTWTFLETRIADHSDWFLEDSDNSVWTAGRMKFGPLATKLIDRYARYAMELRTKSFTHEDALRIKAKWWPETRYQREVEAVRAEGDAEQKRLTEAVARGEWVWGK